ncbi:Trypsin-like peptidase domain-containing protein [Massilia sp. CF038]|nr:Trypsin-like peptidase domain-containing protein [Massilia sp. CF038]
MSFRQSIVLLFCSIGAIVPGLAADFPTTIAQVKQSVVGVGSFQKTRSPAVRFNGTGFATGDGLQIITNAHVVPSVLDTNNMETLGISIGHGVNFEFRPAVVVSIDREHDLAHLAISGKPLPALQLGDSGQMQEGRELAFTGYPLGMMLGLHPVTHRALLSAITPVVMPSLTSGKLKPGAIAALQRDGFPIFQLDATAYPGNSGSPVYDPASGTVYGIINMVFVKGLKESAITDPSGITYAVPANHARDLLQRKDTRAK